jgi:hypothetical protein
MYRIVIGLAAVLALASCAHQPQLVPAPEAQTVPGHPRVAEETVENVRVHVDSGAWNRGRLDAVLAPVLVSIENRSGRPLRVTYNELTLAGANGFRMAALPPFQVAAQNVTPVPAPAFVSARFSMAPWQAPFYPAFGVWPGPFAFDTLYFDRWYPAWPSQPNTDVLQAALPEGVVEDGGRVQGFVYFRTEPRGTPVRFLFALLDANTGHPFGMIDIPFTVK